VLEAHVTYNREVQAGDPLRITTQILDHDEKRLHFFHTMYHGSEGWLAATNELMMLHIDYATRRAAPWHPATLRRLEAMAAAHKVLRRPDKAGRVIGIARKPRG
jgi:acyl-CoA thioester hydrolase